MPPLVEIENLKTWFYTDAGVVRAVDDVSLVIPQGKTLGAGGRKRLRQKCNGAIDHAADRQARSHRRRADCDAPQRPAAGAFRTARAGNAARPRRTGFDDFSGADDVAESDLHHRLANRRSDSVAPAGRQSRGPPPVDRNAAQGATFPSRKNGSTNIPTNSPAACGNAR